MSFSLGSHPFERMKMGREEDRAFWFVNAGLKTKGNMDESSFIYYNGHMITFHLSPPHSLHTHLITPLNPLISSGLLV